MSRIRFQILPPIRRPEEPLRICGDLPALGGWDPARALTLRWQDRWHVGEVELPEGTPFAYKIVREGWESEAVNADGSIPGNHQAQAADGLLLKHVVADWADRLSGRLIRETLRSAVLRETRDVLIWLPPSYEEARRRRYPLLLLTDGATLFDPTTSPFSGIDWAVDEWISALSAGGEIPEFIVAGVCHPTAMQAEPISARDCELSPQRNGTTYTAFLTGELLPHLDTGYRTLGTPASRVVGGAGLGALHAFGLVLERPDLVQRAIALSTSFEDVALEPPAHSRALRQLERRESLPSGLRVFFDYGTEGVDECYEPYHIELGGILREKGWRDGNAFTVRRIAGGSHDELSWRFRFPEALRFVSG